MNKFITKAVLMAGLVTSATLAFGEGIASANVVGYSQTALKEGFSGAGAQFVPVSGDEMDLTDIVPTGYGDTCAGVINIQSLDAKGRCVANSEYFWYDIGEFYGWYDGSDVKVEKGQVVFKPGEGVWVYAGAETHALQSSGQVPNVGIDVALRSGFKLVCNPTPVAINFNDDDNNGKFIAVSGYGQTCAGSVNVQKLDTKGRCVANSEYFWYDISSYYGWYDGSDTFVSDQQLGAGESLWVYSADDSSVFGFPIILQ